MNVLKRSIRRFETSLSCLAYEIYMCTNINIYVYKLLVGSKSPGLSVVAQS